jgi:hypothetical protein
VGDAPVRALAPPPLRAGLLAAPRTIESVDVYLASTTGPAVG